MEVPLPLYDELKIAMARLKNNKAAGSIGLPAVLFKAGRDKLIGRMNPVICKIWLAESMPTEWNLNMLKKGDRPICENYRDIS